jgi:two-component system, LytTR family, response regulator
MIKAVIIDDEPALLEHNKRLLAKFFPEIILEGTASDVKSSIQLITKKNPQLVVLDIELGSESAFDLLQQLKPYSFKVIFITGFNTYAIKAIKYSALDYILKPVSESEFQMAIQRAVTEISQEEQNTLQSEILFEVYKKASRPQKIVLKTMDSLHLVNVNEILYCRSDNSYTTFFLENDEKIMISKSLKEYEELLSEHHFFRCHQSFLVNVNHVKKIDKTDGGFIVMKNGAEIPVALRQKKKIIQLIEKL